jgi:hypothetical protein
MFQPPASACATFPTSTAGHELSNVLTWKHRSFGLTGSSNSLAAATHWQQQLTGSSNSLAAEFAGSVVAEVIWGFRNGTPHHNSVEPGAHCDRSSLRGI